MGKVTSGKDIYKDKGYDKDDRGDLPSEMPDNIKNDSKKSKKEQKIVKIKKIVTDKLDITCPVCHKSEGFRYIGTKIVPEFIKRWTFIQREIYECLSCGSVFLW